VVNVGGVRYPAIPTYSPAKPPQPTPSRLAAAGDSFGP
jgi:hypothetical protein